MKKHTHTQISGRRVKVRLSKKRYRYIEEPLESVANATVEGRLTTLTQLGWVNRARDAELSALKYRRSSFNTRHHSLGKIFSMHELCQRVVLHIKGLFK